MNVILFLLQTSFAIYLYLFLQKKFNKGKAIKILAILFASAPILFLLITVGYAYTTKLLPKINTNEIWEYYLVGFFLSYAFIIGFSLMMYMAFFIIDKVFSIHTHNRSLMETKEMIKKNLPYVFFVLVMFVIFGTWFIR